MPRSLTPTTTVHGGVPLVALPTGDPSVRLWLTTRHGGVSAAPYNTLNVALHVGDHEPDVRTNRARLAAALGVTEVRYLDQVHGATLVASTDERRTGDLVVVAPGTSAAVLAADCIPFAVLDGRGGVVLAHAGWRGLVAGVPDAALAAFSDVGSLRVIVGPAIAADRYQVGPEVRNAHPSFVAHAITDGDRYLLDLRGALVSQLINAGVADDAITMLDAHTGDGTFFSDRAARPCGRFALVATVASRLDGKA